MPLDEETIQRLEEQIPELATEAFTKAYNQALAAGLSVIEGFNGFIYEVFPDGTRRLIEQIAAPVPMQQGTRINLR